MTIWLIVTCIAAVISIGFRAMGPRPNGWQVIPDVDPLAFQRSFGIEPE